MGSIIDQVRFDQATYEIDNNPVFMRLVCRVCGSMIVSSIFDLDFDCGQCESEGVMVVRRDFQNN